MSSFNTNEEIKELIEPQSKEPIKNNDSSTLMPKSSISNAENDKENIIKSNEEQKENNDQSTSLYLLEITNATGTKGTLVVYPNTVPEEMAFSYSKQHNLDYQTMKEIEKAIKNILKQFINKNEKSQTEHGTILKKIKEKKNNQIPYKSKQRTRPLSTRIPFKTTKLQTPDSKKKINKRYIDNKIVNLGIYLYHQGQKQQEKVNHKLETIKQQLESKMNSILTFKPEKFTSNLSYNTLPNPKNDQLSKVDKIKQERNMKMPFKPIINNNYFIKESFQERLNKYNVKTNQNKKRIEDEVNCNYDHNSGQEFFKPKLIAKSIIDRANKNVFELNYDYASYYQRDKDYLQSLKSKEESQPIKFSNDTDEIFQNKKIKSFKQLFKILDNDKDDAISYLNINSKGIPESIRKIIQPIIDEIIHQQVTIYQSEFIQAMNLFFVYLDIRDKWILLNIGKLNTPSKNGLNVPLFTFRPNLSLSQKRINRCSSAGNAEMNQRH